MAAGDEEIGSLGRSWVCSVLSPQSCLTLCDPMDCSPPRVPCPWDSPDKNSGLGCQALFQGIFPTQGLNSGLLQVLLQVDSVLLSHQGSPRKVMYALLYSKWITNCIAHGILLNVMCQPGWEGSLWESGYTYVQTESHHCSPETLTTLLIGYTSMPNTKFLKT